MIVNLSNLSIKSEFFAQIICKATVDNPLKDGTLYVFTDNKAEWEEMVLKVKESIKNCKLTTLWHMPYNIESLMELPLLKDNTEFAEYFENGLNLLMPLYTPDRDTKCYLIGKIDDPQYIEAAFGFLTVDAQLICDECSFAAFATSIERNPEEAKQFWFRLLDYNCKAAFSEEHHTSFRGKYNAGVSEYTFLGPEFKRYLKFPKTNYSDLMKAIESYPDTIAAISNNSDEELKKTPKLDYAKFCSCLSELEKNELILELSKRIDDKNILSDAINTVLNKGKSSHLKVKLIPKKDMKLAGYDKRIKGDWCTCLISNNGTMRWLDFEPAAHVIYVMNLIHRLNNPDEELSNVDICRHKEEFLDVYDVLYGDSAKNIDFYDNKNEGERQYERLIKGENADNNRRSRLTDCYKIITNCVNEHCSFFNESPSPYITNKDKPLTINSNLIEIPDSFKISLKSYFSKKI